MPDSAETLALIRRALREDIGGGDVTTLALVPSRTRARAVVLCKADGVVCGLTVAARVFASLSPGVTFRALVRDGDRVKAGDTLAVVTGPARPILTGERVALNLLCHLSGVATATRRLVDPAGAKGTAKGAGRPPVILDTRKTLPGLRRLQRYAVRMGGGSNHRYDLSMMVLIKDNHIALAGGVTEAVRRVQAWKKGNPGKDVPVEVEVKSLAELREALALPVDRIMLDNMGPAAVRRAVAIAAGRVPLEVSGGITAKKIAALRGAGVDFLSSGALTHSVAALDLSLEVELLP